MSTTIKKGTVRLRPWARGYIMMLRETESDPMDPGCWSRQFIMIIVAARLVSVKSVHWAEEYIMKLVNRGEKSSLFFAVARLLHLRRAMLDKF